MSDEKPHNVEDDAKGAKQGGEARRGNPDALPESLGRKDPAVAGTNETQETEPK